MSPPTSVAVLCPASIHAGRFNKIHGSPVAPFPIYHDRVNISHRIYMNLGRYVKNARYFLRALLNGLATFRKATSKLSIRSV